ncbi:MAG: T9SS type A sorting domain-containing protein [Candidatus Kapaibacterium sp.]
MFRDLFAPTVVDPDNGVAGPFPLGFAFEYNNQIYTQIYVCVNGWLSFQNPGGYITDDPYSLFNGARPNLTIAPFFGDHYLRTPINDDLDPQFRQYTPSTIRIVRKTGIVQPRRDTTVVEWEDMNINYRFDPTRPNDPFAPVANVKPQAGSVGSFQAWLIQAQPGNPSQQGRIEFHYGPIGPRVPFPDTVGVIVKVSSCSVGIEDEPSVPGGQTSFINAVAYRETGRQDSTNFSRRLTRVWPPTGFPARIFIFEGNGVRRIQTWGDGDADLTQLNLTVPQYIREDQRRFVTFLDVIRILRHQATRSDSIPRPIDTNGVDPSHLRFDYSFGRHGFHGDVNHNGRFYYSTRNYNNTADSLGFNNRLVTYEVKFPIKSDNYQTPFPADNSFNGFLYDADEFDASLIMLYLSAKLPVLPWLPDTLPSFTGKFVAGTMANDVQLARGGSVVGNRVEIPITFNGYLHGALGVGMDASNGTRIVEVRTMPKTDNAWVEAVASQSHLALAAAGNFNPNDVVATLVVEANDQGEVSFGTVKVGSDVKSARKFNIFSPVTGDASTLGLTSNAPNPFAPNTTTSFGYTVPTDGPVAIRVYDVLGHEVATVLNSSLKSGSYLGTWNGIDSFGKPVTSGVYYCRIESNGQSRTISMQVSK